ncbi:DUF5320 domain-containing protein [Patescibacteria group bacterium]|nr:DUF5320 domain-containing protein [Patescibacteria group bacterium]
MPAQDKTGPQGMGPLTGRGLGNCRGLRMGFRMNRRPGMGRDKKTELQEVEKAKKAL